MKKLILFLALVTLSIKVESQSQYKSHPIFPNYEVVPSEWILIESRNFRFSETQKSIPYEFEKSKIAKFALLVQLGEVWRICEVGYFKPDGNLKNEFREAGFYHLLIEQKDKVYYLEIIAREGVSSMKLFKSIF